MCTRLLFYAFVPIAAFNSLLSSVVRAQSGELSSGDDRDRDSLQEPVTQRRLEGDEGP